MADRNAVKSRGANREERHYRLDHSLLMPSLKHGTVYRIQLDAAGTVVVGERREQAARHALFIATDIGGNTQDALGRPAAMVENPGAILEFRYKTDRSR